MGLTYFDPDIIILSSRFFRHKKVVLFGNIELPLYLELCCLSTHGFDWGYPGDGPSQLAFAILFHITKNLEKSLMLHEKFKLECLSFGCPFDSDLILSANQCIHWYNENLVILNELLY